MACPLITYYKARRLVVREESCHPGPWEDFRKGMGSMHAQNAIATVVHSTLILHYYLVVITWTRQMVIVVRTFCIGYGTTYRTDTMEQSLASSCSWLYYWKFTLLLVVTFVCDVTLGTTKYFSCSSKRFCTEIDIGNVSRHAQRWVELANSERECWCFKYFAHFTLRSLENVKFDINFLGKKIRLVGSDHAGKLIHV